MREDVLAVVARYWDGLWRRHDLAVVEELIGESFVRHSASGTRRMNRAEYRQEIEYAWRVLHDSVTTIEDQAVAGDRVWTRATTRGVNIDTGESVVVTWMVVHRVADGRIAESWNATLPGVDWSAP